MTYKAVNIIGTSFYGCMLALNLRKLNDKIRINLIDQSSEIINAWKEININDNLLNPGFHALEIPRSNALLDFLEKIGVKFNIYDEPRGILIDREIREYGFDYYKSKKILFSKTEKNISVSDPNDLLSKLSLQEKKFISTAQNINLFEVNKKFGQIFPWFYSKNYRLVNDDEGNRYNSLVRDKKIIQKYAIPISGLFSEISKKVRYFLDKKNVNIHLNNKINFSKLKKNRVFGDKNELNVITVPVPFISSQLKDLKLISKINLQKKDYYVYLFEIGNYKKYKINNFTEIITLSNDIKGLKRLSFPKNLKTKRNKRKLAIEIETDSSANPDSIIKKLKKYLSDLGINDGDITDLGYKKVRNTFFLKRGNYSEAILELDKLVSSVNNVIIPRFITWPINTNKQFWFSIEDSYLLDSLLRKD